MTIFKLTLNVYSICSSNMNFYILQNFFFSSQKIWRKSLADASQHCHLM